MLVWEPTRSDTTTAADVEFMGHLERGYRAASGLTSRSSYKIFYGLVRSAPLLVLGINPGGDPAATSSDGLRHVDGRLASASATFHEGNECDLLDCRWRGNDGLKKLLVPLLNGVESSIRTEVVQTNMAFRRSARRTDIDIAKAMDEARPFLREIVARVQPHLVILAGPALDKFLTWYTTSSVLIEPEQRDPKVGHIVFAAARAKLLGASAESVVVQVAHASQFSWTYERYQVANRIRKLLWQFQRELGVLSPFAAEGL
jgi:hypothetical protein